MCRPVLGAAFLVAVDNKVVVALDAVKQLFALVLGFILSAVGTTSLHEFTFNR